MDLSTFSVDKSVYEMHITRCKPHSRWSFIRLFNFAAILFVYIYQWVTASDQNMTDIGETNRGQTPNKFIHVHILALSIAPG